MYVLTIEFSKTRRSIFVRLYVKFSRLLCLLRVFISGVMELPITKSKTDLPLNCRINSRLSSANYYHVLSIFYIYRKHSVVSPSVFLKKIVLSIPHWACSIGHIFVFAVPPNFIRPYVIIRLSIVSMDRRRQLTGHKYLILYMRLQNLIGSFCYVTKLLLEIAFAIICYT